MVDTVKQFRSDRGWLHLEARRYDGFCWVKRARGLRFEVRFEVEV